jgi:hypothetical protein
LMAMMVATVPAAAMTLIVTVECMCAAGSMSGRSPKGMTRLNLKLDDHLHRPVIDLC